MQKIKSKKTALKTRIKNEIVKDVHIVGDKVKQVKKVTNESPVKLYHHLMGDRFSHPHKMFVGLLVMISGVACAKFGHAIHHSVVIVFLSDGLGYFLHGIGSLPIVEYIAYRYKSIVNEKKDDDIG